MLVLLVSESTALYQLGKLPKLYQHFIEHQTLNSSVSFTEYLSMHYWGDDMTNDDDKEDMQLPFKEYDILTPAFLFVSMGKGYAIKNQGWPIKADFGVDRTMVHYNPALANLFRPPKS